jgi:putative ABC transport system permease protein
MRVLLPGSIGAKLRRSFELAVRSLWLHKLRTFLSVLGIIIGIGSFSIMQSVGEGARQETIRIMKELGSDVLTLNQSVDPSDAGSKAYRPTIEDIRNWLKGSPAISALCGKISEQVELPLPGVNEVEVHPVAGVSANFCQVFKLEAASGRLLSDFDFESRNPVCILGNDLASRIFPGENPLNKKIDIKGQLFDIVGVLKAPSRMVMALDDVESQVIIPISVAQRVFGLNRPLTLYVVANDTEAATLELRHLFKARYDSEAVFTIRSQKKLIEAQERNVKVFQYVLWTIGSISLLVGGIGIMNIMLVSVTERLREIGIRRAIGAKRHEILFQFLAESLLLCVIGAVGGMVLGYFGSKLTGQWTRFTPVFSSELLAVSLAIAAFIGIVFGTYPAFRAAKLDPARALRYD